MIRHLRVQLIEDVWRWATLIVLLLLPTLLPAAEASPAIQNNAEDAKAKNSARDKTTAQTTEEKQASAGVVITPAHSDADEVTVIAEGMAALNADVTAAQDEAVWDAKRNAVEQVTGVFLRSRTVGRDLALERKEIDGSTQGFIRRWSLVPDSRRIETVAGSRTGRILHIEIKATVALLPVIRRLTDIADIYKDLERPRLRVQITTARRADGKADGQEKELANRAQEALTAALHAQGFEMAGTETAEVLLIGRLTVMPTVKLGDPDSPYGIGEAMAGCRARLSLQAVSTVSEDVLFTTEVEGAGRSFQNDAEAAETAAGAVGSALLQTSENEFIPHLLVRWAREREEGHPVVIKASGLESRERALLRQAIREMRGFLQFTGESEDKSRFTLHFLTRLETRGVRLHLAALRLTRTALLKILNTRGPIILCAVAEPSHSAH